VCTAVTLSCAAAALSQYLPQIRHHAAVARVLVIVAADSEASVGVEVARVATALPERLLDVLGRAAERCETFFALFV
jgi:hypothetical protein